ncbi:MAG: MBL fold metallo-hydrolase [Proteobacteria bacterium]|nr:MBL fold metallo-hydrolase [Pseudomonadota bacterium]
MALITKRKILDGVFLLEIPEADLRLLCGCPSDAIKHLSAKGLLPMTEKDGVKYESGPNAILLSDVMIQNGDLCNLSEFPVLHMFYNQGMILPGHPNNSSTPILIGKKSFVDAQMDYIFVGNYGLVSEQEFREVGETPEFAAEYLTMKLKFAQGRFIPSDELMTGLYLNDETLEIKNGVFIKRNKLNHFTISYKDQSVKVDLNLKRHHKYQPSYTLPKVRLPNYYFAIIHSGEGDGWDHTRPCLSSIIMYNRKLFLMDAGPNILWTLKSFGIKPQQIEGVFFTHVHDDHFAGLHSLIHPKRKIKIFATSTVKSTIVTKLNALFKGSGLDYNDCMLFHDLDREVWNDYGGLEIQPIPSAHPIDTTIFIFRVKAGNGYKSYGHYSDIVALNWLKKMKAKADRPGITDEYYDKIKESFEIKVNVKKIDVGGPVVHGDAEDFVDDDSDRLVMGHTHAPFTSRQLEIGDEVAFGEIDVLIDSKPSG